MEGDNEAMRSMLKSAFNRSFFNHLEKSTYTSKSKIQIEAISEEEARNIDENTMRIYENFKFPEQNAVIYKKTGIVFIEQASFFSCLINRAPHQLCLVNNELYLRSGNKLKYFIDFSLVAVEVKKTGDGFVLSIQKEKKEFYFEPRHETDSATQSWFKLLNEVISKSEGLNKGYIYLPTYVENFYKNLQISNDQFLKKANSGDIILFRSEHSAARVQRFFTNSEYDHVGMVLRNKKNELFIFESTSDVGVGLTPWKYMIKYEWYKSTQKVAWRRLNMKIGKEETSIIERFVAGNLNKEFNLTISKIFRTESLVGKQDSRTYFCSELIAKMYKQLGLLDKETASSQYYPVQFSDSGRMNFIKKQVSLDPEMIIAFNV